MIDIGVNLTSARFDKDRADVIARAQAANVSAMLVTGTNVIESQKALDLCQQYPHYLYSTAGVHPHDADHVSEDYLAILRDIIKHPQVKAVGECGLDFNRNFSTPENQQRVFEQQLSLAADVQLPVFLHQRDAFDTWLTIIKPFLSQIPAFISHCFTGNLSELKQCLDHDMYIGITGWLCDERRGQELRDIVKYIPLERLLIETDAPYLTPRTIRPKPKSSRNEPAYLHYVLKALSETMGYDEKEILSYSQANSLRVFNLEQ